MGTMGSSPKPTTQSLPCTSLSFSLPVWPLPSLRLFPSRLMLDTVLDSVLDTPVPLVLDTLLPQLPMLLAQLPMLLAQLPPLLSQLPMLLPSCSRPDRSPPACRRSPQRLRHWTCPCRPPCSRCCCRYPSCWSWSPRGCHLWPSCSQTGCQGSHRRELHRAR